MGANLRVVHTALADTLDPTITSEAGGAFVAENLRDGRLDTRWKASSAADQYYTFDAGGGNTKTADVLVIGRADLLVTAGTTVVVQHSTDNFAANIVNAFSPKALATGDLLGPRTQHWYVEFGGIGAKRSWRVGLLGSASAPQAALITLGTLVELGANPDIGVEGGVARTTMGRTFALAWPSVTLATIGQLAAWLAAVTPEFPGERPVETAGGAVHGGKTHWLYDPGVKIFRTAPYLLPVVVMTADAEPAEVGRAAWAFGPVTVREVV